VENQPLVFSSARRHTLPPLILHPFSDAGAPDKLTLSARASLILHGLLPPEDSSAEELHRRFLEGRFCEIRMLYYLGKDVSRWLDQCMEVVARDEQLRGAGIERESFARLLVSNPPETVRKKLQAWGVADHQAIFRRALGFHAVFATVPEPGSLAEGFVRDHQRYADSLFTCLLDLASCREISPQSFEFELYASGEYARMLAREWGEEP
jgi:hypothetical protein